MRQPLLRLIFLGLTFFAVATAALAQSCGAGDTLIVAANNSATYSLNIADYVNDDLADPAQGLCGIEIGFVHGFVENLELALTSPAGQSVALIGPNSDDPFAATFGTRWNIDFVPCGETAQPDFPFDPRWDNNQATNWAILAAYSGSYYPFQGCLEDFNTGPVNGEWTLNITNNPSNNPGAITYLRLVFCDARGVECCFAVAGLLDNEDILICEGSDTLLIEPELRFPAGPADTTEHGYAFLLQRDGIYERLDSVLDLRMAPPGVYDICGLSYRRSELDSLALPNGTLTIDSIRQNLTSLEPDLCAELTPTCLQVTILAPPDTTRLTERICTGDTIFVNDVPFSSTGNYVSELIGQGGCDSIVTLDLFVQAELSTDLQVTVCPGDTVLVGNNAYFATGFYRDTLASTELGCDSIVTLDLTVNAPIVTDLSPVICAGDNFAVGDSILTNAGQYEIVLTAATTCDSLVRVDLTVLDPLATITGPNVIDCSQTEVTLSAESSTPNGQLTYLWTDLDNNSLGENTTFTTATGGTYLLAVSQSQSGTTCTNRDTIVVIQDDAPPVADTGPDTLLTCNHPSITVGGPLTSTGADLTYAWSTLDGELPIINTQPTLTVDVTGTYTLIVTNEQNTCRDTSSVSVGDGQTPPEVSLPPSFTLNCAVLSDTLDGSSNLLDNTFTAAWTGPGILEVLPPAAIVAAAPGEYTLTITNTLTGCVAQDSVEVFEDLRPAVAVITPVDTITCTAPVVGLSALSSTPTDLTYLWLGPRLLEPIGDPDNLTDTAGTYQLIVQRTDNFCRDTTTVTVIENRLFPLVQLGPDTVVNCYNEQIVLRNTPPLAVGSATYQWFNGNSPIVDANTDSLRVTETGTFVLEATFFDNGCTSRDTVMVSENFLPPEVVEAGPGGQLNCANEVLRLVPDSTGFARPVSWEWQGPCFTSPTDSWAVETNCPGLYTLVVTSIESGCTANDTVRILQSVNFSQAVLPDSLLLDCETGEVALANAGSTGSIFRWFRDGIQISLPNNSPVVDQAGMYELIVSDLGMTCADTARTIVRIDCSVTASIAPPATITCSEPITVLDGSPSVVEGDFTYQWIPPAAGCVLSSTTADTLAAICAGEYTLIVEQSLFGLRDTTTVEVLIDTLAPVIDAGDPQVITCVDTLIERTAMVNGPVEDYDFIWTRLPSEEASLGDTLRTNMPGTYLLEVTNLDNGCRSTDAVQITTDNLPPSIAFGNTAIPCMEGTLALQAFVSPVSANDVYAWSGPGIIADADSLTTIINAIGQYTFSVLNTANGCSNRAEVAVTQQDCVPCLELLDNDTLTCLANTLSLTATFCEACVDCVVQWSDETGTIAGATNLSLEVSTAGSYTITATDTLGFSSMETVVVTDLRSTPTVDLGPDRSLDCDSNSLLVRNLLMNPDSADFSWQLLSGASLATQNPFVTITEPDTYVLRVTDLRNGCFAADTITIGIDTLPPVAEAGPDQTLTCGSPVVTLDGSGSSFTLVTYAWTAPNPGCLSGDDTVQPLASCPGWYYLTVQSNQNGCTATDSVFVDQSDVLPILTPLADTSLSCVRDSILLTASVPTGDFSTQWCQLDADGTIIPTSCQNSAELLVTAAGEYRFSVTDTFTQCSAFYVVAVASDTLPPTLDAGADDVFLCTSDALQLQASSEPNTTLLWTQAQGADIVPNDVLDPVIYQPGTYVLRATALSNGCTAQDSVHILTDENAPTLAPLTDTVLTCAVTQLRLNATGVTNGGSATWAWTTANGLLLTDQNSPMPLVGDTGTYFVTLTDPSNNCTVTDSLLITSNRAAPQAQIANLADLLLTCETDTLLLDASPSTSANGAELSYTWQINGAGNLFPNLSEATTFSNEPGNYVLRVEDTQNGCRDTLNFSLGANFVPPSLTLAVPDSLGCGNTDVTLSTTTPGTDSGFTFTWQDADEVVISNAPTATVASTGTYQLILTAEENGCSTTETVMVVENENLPAVNILPAAEISCENATVLLDGTGSAAGPSITYQWTSPTGGTLLGGGEAGQDSTQVAGTYVLTVFDSLSGCSQTDTVVVAANDAVITGLVLTQNNPPCADDPFGSINVDSVSGGTGPFLYALDDQSLSLDNTFNNLIPDLYTLTVEDAVGCTWTETVTIVPSSPLRVDLGDDQTIQLGSPTTLEPIISPDLPNPVFAWLPVESTPPPTELAPTVSPIATQFYVLEVQDENGCAARDTIQIFVEEVREVFIPNAFSPNGDEINDELMVFAGPAVEQVIDFQIFNRWGTLMYARTNFAPNDPNIAWDGKLAGQPVNSGVFVYQIQLRYIDGQTRTFTGEIILVR
ncbi:MAG: gliding motility-associated C-terminal domain-containing protein [Bacteroidota bacterium]